MQSIPVSSKEFVLVSVTATIDGAPHDPTDDLVEFSFTAVGSDPGTWNTGSWDTDPQPSTATYTARCLIGPGTPLALAKGKYAVWLRITDSPEIPVRNVGQLLIT